MRTILLTLTLLVAAAPIARAQADMQAKAAADALFDDGKHLLAGGDIEGACAKFAASLKVLDQLGTRLNLADCDERAGRTASAWAGFRTAAFQAEKLGDARAAYANGRAAALEPKLVKLRIAIAPAHHVPDLQVRRDDTPVPAAALGSPIPVDPGKHTVAAIATGYRGWTTTVDASNPGTTVTVEIPALVPAPSAPQPAPVAHTAMVDTAPATRHRRHVLGLAIGGTGVVAAGVGLALGIEAKAKWNQAAPHCNAANQCDATGVSIDRSARSLGDAGTVIGVVGLAAAATGAILYLTAPSARPVLEHASLDVTPEGTVQLGWTGRF